MFSQKSKSLPILLAAVFAAALLWIGAFLPSSETVSARAMTDGFQVTAGDVTTSYSALEEAWAAASEAAQPATVKMLADAEINQTLEVASGKNITLDLNGCELALAESASGAVIYVEGTLTVEDGNGGGVITGGKKSNTESNSYGGGVRVYRGTFYLNGGTISGNRSRNGAGVYVINGKMVLDGGTISGNISEEFGGGIYLCSAGGEGDAPSELEIKRGEILWNKVTGNGSYGGGGVCIEDGCKVTMTDGKIIGNTTYAESGDPNTHYGMGGGVLVNKGTFTMSGGEISGNASVVGGGVAVAGVVVENSAVMKLSGGVVCDNTGSGGILVLDDQVLELSGNPVVKSNAQSNGVVADVLPYGNLRVTGALTSGARIGAYLLSADTPKIKDYGTFNTEPANTFFVSNRASKYCFDLNGVDLELKEHDLVDVEAKAATCTEKGYEAHKQCSRCAARTQYTEIAAKGHDLTHHAAVEATADADGNIEYWACADCGKYFSDDNGETASEIVDKASVIIPKRNADGGLSAGAIAGIAIGSVVFALLVAYVACYFALYRRGILLKNKAFAVIYAPMNAIFKKKKEEE